MKTIHIILSILLTSSLWSAEIVISTLNDSKDSRRERAFEDWTPLAESQKQFDEFTEKGKIPLFKEWNETQFRSLYEDRVKGSIFWTYSGMSEKKLLMKRKEITGQGFVLISMNKIGDKYWATWVSKSSQKKYLKLLKRYGISKAELKL